MCVECKGQRLINRPIKTKYHEVSAREASGSWGTGWATSVIGGVDACPACAAKAEAEYMSREDDVKEAFKDGKNGYREGEDNPHTPGTAEYRHWNHGYRLEKQWCEQKEDE